MWERKLVVVSLLLVLFARGEMVGQWSRVNENVGPMLSGVLRTAISSSRENYHQSQLAGQFVCEKKILSEQHQVVAGMKIKFIIIGALSDSLSTNQNGRCPPTITALDRYEVVVWYKGWEPKKYDVLSVKKLKEVGGHHLLRELDSVKDNEKTLIDAWIKQNKLNQYGDKIGTMYAGGTPLFNEASGIETSRYEYIVNHFPGKPWKGARLLSNFEEGEKDQIDRWIKKNNLNDVGDPRNTAYAGGSPLFDETTGKMKSKYNYILQHHPTKPWRLMTKKATVTSISSGQSSTRSGFSAIFFVISLACTSGLAFLVLFRKKTFTDNGYQRISQL